MLNSGPLSEWRTSGIPCLAICCFRKLMTKAFELSLSCVSSNGTLINNSRVQKISLEQGQTFLRLTPAKVDQELDEVARNP